MNDRDPMWELMDTVSKALEQAGYRVDRTPLDAPEEHPDADYAVVAFTDDPQYGSIGYYVEVSSR